MRKTNEELDAKFKTLPQELQAAISSPQNTERLEEIGEEFGLNLDQTGELGEEIGMVMMGFTLAQDFAKNVSERLNLNSETVAKITEAVNAKIFLPIRDSLRKIQEQQDEKEEVTLDREQVLKEIENPIQKEVTTRNVAPVQKIEPTPVPEITPPIPGTLPGETDHTTPLKTPGILEQKLSTPMQSPVPKKTYAVDPYREPIN